MTPSLALRTPCPPGACTCGHAALVKTPDADLRILRLTRQEETRLLERLEEIRDLADLDHLRHRLHEQLGVELRVAPGFGEVRSMRGISIQLAEQPGLCRKTRRNIPAAIRRALQKRPEIAFALLNANDLLRDA